jgi:hypothetical protein
MAEKKRQPNMVRERRLGTFSVPRCYLETRPDAVAEMMCGMVVVRCEFRYAQNALVYEAFSPDFAPVDSALEPPHYHIVCDGGNAADPVRLRLEGTE